MSSKDIVVKVDNVSKCYRIGVKNIVHDNFASAAFDLIKSPVRNLRKYRSLYRFDDIEVMSNGNPGNHPRDIIWALRDVSFDVKRGEVLGIIGSNGAGKSTLLKVLARITAPTKGRVEYRGRITSLLEVGTGFHPELTGRENVYLNGTILGMRKEEVDRKFDQIVAFSGVEQFIDTPVKRYSSGMKVRLAFSVAAHLEAEIAVIDEVLAVGDAAFQRKCLAKMGDVARSGRTILFVTHNMIAARNLCSRAIWLQDGSIVKSGDTSEVTEAYRRESLTAESLTDIPALLESLPSDSAVRLEGIEIRQNGQATNVVLNGQAVQIEIRYSVLERTPGLRVYFDLLDNEHNILIRSFHDEDAEAIPTMDPGCYVSTVTIPSDFLAPLSYEVRVRASIFNVRSCTGGGVGIPLTVQPSSAVNRGYACDTVRAKLQPKLSWVTRESA